MAWHAIEAILVLWAVDSASARGQLGLLLSVGSVGAVLGALLTKASLGASASGARCGAPRASEQRGRPSDPAGGQRRW